MAAWAARIRGDPRGFLRAFMREATSSSFSRRQAAAASPRQRQVAIQYPCAACPCVFESRQACAVHVFKVHGVGREVRVRVDTTHCPVCLQEFWTRERVVCHLAEKSRRCLHVLTSEASPLPEDVVATLDNDGAAECKRLTKQGLRRHFASAPVVRLAGPLTAAANAAGVDHRTLLRSGLPVPAGPCPPPRLDPAVAAP